METGSSDTQALQLRRRGLREGRMGSSWSAGRQWRSPPPLRHLPLPPQVTTAPPVRVKAASAHPPCGPELWPPGCRSSHRLSPPKTPMGLRTKLVYPVKGSLLRRVHVSPHLGPTRSL